VSRKTGNESFETEIRSLFARHLEEYLKERSCLTPTCIFTAAFQRRPRLFVENLPALVEAALSDNVRPFRRHEACDLMQCLLIKDALIGVKDKSDKKTAASWKRFVNRLQSGVLEMISKQDILDKKQDQKSAEATTSSVRPGDYFDIFLLLRTVANLRDVVPLKHLQEDSFVDELEKITPTSKIGQLKSGLGSHRQVKLSKICSEIVKKLRPLTAENAKEETVGDEKKEDEEQATPPSKKRKTKG